MFAPLAFDSYADVLRVVARELRVDKAVDRIDDKLRLAMMLPLTEGPEDAGRLRNEILG